ncbi:MAG: T9SS type A sorting domain-containing protein, partial [bacterium]|nr:T9SS type A sorting domain-containing protein [bacterium]
SYWFPEQDSIFAAGDSMIFSVNFPGDSCRFQWSINSAVDSATTDSVFIYRLARHTSIIDTIQVQIFAPDTLVTHQWFLFHSNLNQAKSELAVTFNPVNEIVECNSQDSLKFSVLVIDGKFEAMRFFWFINETPDTTFQDTTFLYQPGLLSKNSDTITIKIVYNDSTFSHQWIIKKNQTSILPAPKLLFPIKGDHVTEEELFIWQNDSSLARIDSLRSCRFIIQIAKDTTFKQIVSMDTCKTSSIALKNLSGFNQISMAKPYYWRAKLITKNNSMSDFKKCEAPFYYHPLFAKVENFYGQKNVEGFIDLFWVTSYEKNCAGFNLYRSESENENFAKLNDQLITGKANFAYQDRAIDAGITYYYKLEDICLNGRKKFLQTITVTAPQPEKYCLYQNFPNPFNSLTYFKYEIPIETRVRIEVFNVLGRKLKTLVDEDKEAGFYTVYWDGIDDQGKSVVSGIYFYHMSTTKFNMTHKMIVVR